MINRIMKRIRKKLKGKPRKDIIKRSWKGQWNQNEYRRSNKFYGKLSQI